MPDQFGVTAQFVGSDDPRVPKLTDQPCQKAFGGHGIAARLDKDVEHVAGSIGRASEPMLYSVDRDHNLIKMPLVVRLYSITPDTSGKTRAQTIDTKPDFFPAYSHATLGKQILDICRAQREPMVSPDRVCDDLTRVAKALQARH